MPHNPTARNNMLGAIGVTHASVHSGFPGTTGANEISGGAPAYARRVVTFAAADAGSRAQTGTAVFDIPAGATARYFAFWDALTGGNCLGYHPIGGAGFAAREFVVDAAADLIRVPAHGYANTDTIVFAGGAAPGGLTEGTVFFVVGATTDTIQVAAAGGGAAIDLTSQAADACQLIKLIAETFGSQATLTLSGAALSLLL
jgi:hypothetical protein